jgi:LysM repeat protein
VDEAQARSEYLKFFGLIVFFGLLMAGAAWLRPRIGEPPPPPSTATPVALPSPTAITWLSLESAVPDVTTTELVPSRPPEQSSTPEPTTEPTPEPTPEPTLELMPETYVVRAGDTLSRIGRAYGVTVDRLAAANSISNPNLILVGQTLIIPGRETPVPSATPVEAQVETYVVRPGDTLWRISRDLGADMGALAAANQIADVNRIRAGQVLTVPR